MRNCSQPMRNCSQPTKNLPHERRNASLNEELHTVNTELRSKIDDSVRVNNDMNNLLKSNQYCYIVPWQKFEIRNNTVPVTKIFKLIKSDIGRYLLTRLLIWTTRNCMRMLRWFLSTLEYVRNQCLRLTEDGLESVLCLTGHSKKNRWTGHHIYWNNKIKTAWEWLLESQMMLFARLLR